MLRSPRRTTLSAACHQKRVVGRPVLLDCFKALVELYTSRLFTHEVMSRRHEDGAEDHRQRGWQPKASARGLLVWTWREH